jgi:DNA polymerase V
MTESSNQKPRVSALPTGFGGSYDEYEGSGLNLNKLLISRPASTFFMRVAGEDCPGGGIVDGDIIIVDRSLDAKNNDLVVAVVDGQLLIRQFIEKDGCVQLSKEEFGEVLSFSQAQELEIFGVVTSSIREHRK